MAEGSGEPEVDKEKVNITAEVSNVAGNESQKEFEIVDWFKNKITESRVTFVVYYRGYW